MAAGRGAAELLRNAVVVNNAAGGKHTATLLFLHGLGDTGHEWAQILTAIRPPSLKIVCPNAPIAPVTLHEGIRMPSWFDIYSLDKRAKQDEEGIQQAAREIHEVLDVECKEPGISADRVILGGFSQGGSLAIFSALTYPKRLAGIVGLSTYISLSHILEKIIPSSENRDVPFLQCHGDSDPVVEPIVAYKWGQHSSQFISSFNTHNYQFHTYPGLGHSSCDEEMREVQKWLHKCLSLKQANL